MERKEKSKKKECYSLKQFEMEDLKLVMDFAVKLRQKVADLLNKMAPGEYEKKMIKWKYRELRT